MVAVPDSMKGEVPVGFIVMNSGSDASEADVHKEVVGFVRSKGFMKKMCLCVCICCGSKFVLTGLFAEQIGAFACFSKAMVVERLPKTRSGKILRKTLRALANHADNVETPPTIDDPLIIAEIQDVVRRHT